MAPAAPAAEEKPFLESELIFPLEHWHNHASCIVETPSRDLLVCWFHGSGERTADDVKIEGARQRRGASTWSPRYTMADTPGYPDTNCALLVDPQGRLWLLWPTILANEWYKCSDEIPDFIRLLRRWPAQMGKQRSSPCHPGKEFEEAVSKFIAQTEESSAPGGLSRGRSEGHSIVSRGDERARERQIISPARLDDPRPSFILDGTRLIVPLHSDGFSFSLMAISDDWGKNWHASAPLVGGGNIQPSIVRRQDGSLFTLMRDNGPAPKRLHQSESRDRGETWSPVTDSPLPNPGSGAEIIALKNGHWVLISNDTERGRNSLAVQISDDDGKTWKWKQHLEFDAPGPEAGSYHYPSIMQAADGSLHASYSYFLGKPDVAKDADGLPARKSIKHAHFNEAWVMQGESR